MGRRDVPGKGKPSEERGTPAQVIPPPDRPTLPKTFDWWGGCAEGALSDVWTGKAPRTGLNPARNVASKNIFKPTLCPPTPQPGGLLPPMAAGGFSRAPAQGAREKPFSPTSSINGKKERPMKKHTICLEARPFAAFSDEQLDRLTARPDVEVLDCRGGAVDDPAFMGRLQSADIVISGNDLHLDAALLDALPNLRCVAKLGAGLDMIDIPAAVARDITVCNTPGANDVAVAEHTFSLLLGLLRQVPRCDAGMRGGKWEQGAILGRGVASIAQGFGGRVTGFDPYWPEAFAAERNIERRDLDTLLRESDFVCIHCPLTPQTENLIGTRELGLMKPSSVLVNMARGGIVDESALYDALTARHISGAVLDAFSQEPPSSMPFAALPNVLLSPHVGAFTEEALEKMSRIAVDQVFQFLDGERPMHMNVR